VLPSILIHPPPQIQHPPARHSAHTIRRNLSSNALQANEAARNANMSRTSAERQQRGPSHRHAAAGIHSIQQDGKGLVSRVSAGIGPKGVGGHGAADAWAGGEKAETLSQTRPRRCLPLLMIEHAHESLMSLAEKARPDYDSGRSDGPSS
jgi:hypothetical protein